MLRNYFITLFLLIYAFSANLKAQTNEDKYQAKTYFKYQDYNRALVQYLQLYKKDQTDLEVNFRIGYCYLFVNSDKSKAIPYLEYVLNREKKNTDELFLYLGMGYMYVYQFDVAEDYFNKYLNTGNHRKRDIAKRFIINCENSKTLMKYPVDVTFENLGRSINSEFPEFYPFVTADQKTLYFTSSREKNIRKRKSSMGYYTSDIYYSNAEKEEWAKAESIGSTINTVEDEQCVYVSANGKDMIISVDDDYSFGDLFISTTNKKGELSKLIQVSKPVNSRGIELEGCITEDENTVFVSSSRKFGLGETDIYMFKRQPDGKWGRAINLGPNINTKYKEAFPVFDEKNNVLYFSSEGHIGMSGFDLFKSKYDPISQTFGIAENMGYPINTPEDNLQFSLAENKRNGYISAYRKEGYGDLDIYKITFNNIKVETPVEDKKQPMAELNDSMVHVNIPDKPIQKTTEIIYRIQIGVYKNTIVPKKVFKGLNAIYSESFSSGVRYFTGAFKSYTDAVQAKAYIKSIGYKDAFIVAYNDGKRIALSKALIAYND